MIKKKIYGQAKTENCPLCGEPATIKNKQGIPTCRDHKNYTIELRCACGEWLEAREGKYGTYFNCLNCGNISWKKAMIMNGIE